MHGDPPLVFSASGLDRAAHLRGDPQQLAALQTSCEARHLPVWRGKPLAGAGEIGLLAPNHPVLEGAGERVFLGLASGAPRFAVALDDWQAGEAPPPGFSDQTVQHHPLIEPGLGFRELRTLMAGLPPDQAEIAATAKAILGWHETHRFCARCGAPSRPVNCGWQRACPDCAAMHFPRTDPVVIMLVTRAKRVLVGRSPGWPEGMFSLLAGFMEPGETIEAAVRREVREETGIEVGHVRYLASQPWPFPASLMIGCVGQALSDDLTCDPAEIEEALWLTREELAQVFAGGPDRIRPPRQGAIAAFLLREWLADRLGAFRGGRG